VARSSANSGPILQHERISPQGGKSTVAHERATDMSVRPDPGAQKCTARGRKHRGVVRLDGRNLGYRRSFASLKRGGLLCAYGYSASVQAKRRLPSILMSLTRVYLWRGLQSWLPRPYVLPCVRLYPANPGNPRTLIEGESPLQGRTYGLGLAESGPWLGKSKPRRRPVNATFLHELAPNWPPARRWYAG
jgi:hypothetical protein